MNMKITITITITLLIFGSINLKAQSDSTFVMEPLSEEAFEVMRLFFTYDMEFPLEAEILEMTDKEGFTIEKITFNSIHENRVPSILAIPKTGNSPFPCVFLLHGAGKTKEGWFEDSSNYFGVAQGLLASGYAVMMLDAKFFGERESKNDYEKPGYFIFEKHWQYIERDVMVQTTVDYRRAIDYL